MVDSGRLQRGIPQVKSQWRKLDSLGAILAFSNGKTIREEGGGGNNDYFIWFDDGSALRVFTDCLVYSSWTEEHSVVFWASDSVEDRGDLCEDLS